MVGVLARWWVAVPLLGWILLWVLGVYGLVVAGQAQGFSVSCPLSATDQEAQEAYFNCGRELTIVTKPGSPIHDALKAMRGADVTVVVTTR